jgi:alkaline phosphatase
MTACGLGGDASVTERETRQPSSAEPAVREQAASVTVVAAGDIARTPSDGKGTAALMAARRPDAVLPLGDLAYDRGSLRELRTNYGPTWGAFKAITRPVPGNHEYRTPGATGYFRYFRHQIHGAAYYAWNAGAWRMYAVNCEVACGKGSRQLAWLVKDLARHPHRPALAYLHEPRFTCSTHHAPGIDLKPLWRALQRATGQVLLSGHNHAYERFARMTAAGTTSRYGLRQFVVGTGGAERYPLLPSCRHRQAQTDRAFGVLELTLRPRSYDWSFVAVSGRVVDSGTTAVSP